MSCHHIISDSDIENIYDVNGVSSYETDIDCINVSSKSARIDIFSSTGDKINETYIEREYYEDYELRGTRELKLGKVALHQTFFLKEMYQRLGLATSFFWKEINIYRDNGFKEIHLDAVEDGVIVWRTLGYKYLDENTEHTLMRWWYEYFFSTFSDISEEEQLSISSKIKKFEKIPKKYKIPNDRIIFSVWLRSNDLVTAEPMFYQL